MAADSLYDVLGVARDASPAEIRRAYRKQALLSHPDKNPEAEAQSRFLKVAVAYDVLSDTTKRLRYDRGEGNDEEMYDGFDFCRANKVFHAHFGRMLMQQWRPGLTVCGTLQMGDGKKITVTIHPDGSTDEHECELGGRTAHLYRYLTTTTTTTSGGKTFNFWFSTMLGEHLVAVMVPDELARRALMGRIITTAVSWVPTVLVACLTYTCCLRPRYLTRPGAMPDALADAFRHVPSR